MGAVMLALSQCTLASYRRDIMTNCVPLGMTAKVANSRVSQDGIPRAINTQCRTCKKPVTLFLQRAAQPSTLGEEEDEKSSTSQSGEPEYESTEYGSSPEAALSDVPKERALVVYQERAVVVYQPEAAPLDVPKEQALVVYQPESAPLAAPKPVSDPQD